MAGRSIRLFLADGTPQGMRTAEVGKLDRARARVPADGPRAVRRSRRGPPDVYILVGPSETSASGLAVYVGEGDDVWRCPLATRRPHAWSARARQVRVAGTVGAHGRGRAHARSRPSPAPSRAFRPQVH
jgi:hypothetical protein